MENISVIDQRSKVTRLKWDPLPTVVSYRVAYKASGNNPTVIAIPDTTSCQGLVTGLEPNTDYTFYVYAAQKKGVYDAYDRTCIASTTLFDVPNIDDE